MILHDLGIEIVHLAIVWQKKKTRFYSGIIELSFSNLIDLESNFVLYCDQIAFKSTLSIQIPSLYPNQRNEID